jgi:hypothetical protein
VALSRRLPTWQPHVAGDEAAARDPSRDLRRHDAVQAAVWLQREWTAVGDSPKGPLNN